MALFAYYSTHPLPEQITGVEFQSDWKYPYFIATVLPAGLAGLLVAALYAATMSSLDSGINSCSTAFLVDFWQRLKHGQVRPVEEAAGERDSQSHQLFLARALTLVLGAMVTILACFVGALGDIIVIGNKLVNSFAGPMFSIFLLGMLSRRARSMGVCLGAVAGMAVMAWLIFWTDLNFLWPSTFGLVVSLSVGYGLSLFEREPEAEKLEWTLFEQRNCGERRGSIAMNTVKDPVRLQMSRSASLGFLLTALLLFGPACQSTGSDPPKHPPNVPKARSACF